MTNQETNWWRFGVVYQIYPRSFQDSNGDGIGDLPGITRRLDYLVDLGIDAIWISPMYPSPMADFGYDVSNYVDVHPMFGTLDDMDALIAAAHERGLRVILDLVPNHSSDQHPWFQESRSSRDNPKRDWYFWRDPAADGGPPNNWLSRFDGQAGWTLDETTGQYYLHSFLKEQPDLNWRNPGLRAAMLDVMRFWFRRGVDGFRVDVSYRVMKDEALRDNPLNPHYLPGKMDPHKRLVERYSKDLQPDIHEFNRWLRAVANEFPQRVLIGEINLPLERLVTYFGRNDEIHLPFNFHLIFTPWNAEAIRSMVDRYESLLPEDAWPNYVLGNHDQHRVVARIGEAQSRVAMLLLLTLRGTPTMYYGDELGMPDGVIPPERVQDPWEKFVPGMGLGRDPERTPMQWDDSAAAGFSAPGVEPWLPLAPNHQSLNVASETADPGSMLNLTRALLQLRRKHPALHAGDYAPLDSAADIFAFWRTHDEEQLLVVANFSSETREITLPQGKWHPLISARGTLVEAVEARLSLSGDEAVVLKAA